MLELGKSLLGTLLHFRIVRKIASGLLATARRLRLQSPINKFRVELEIIFIVLLFMRRERAKGGRENVQERV